MLRPIELVFLCSITSTAAMVNRSNVNIEGFAKPINQRWLSACMIASHHRVTYSSAVTNHSLGIYKSSVKKIREDKKRKTVSAGPKIRLPSGDKIEMGNPQQIRIGIEKRVIKSWSWAKRAR